MPPDGSAPNLPESAGFHCPRRSIERSAEAVAQRLPDLRAGLQVAEHVDGSDGLAREFRRDVGSDRSETKDRDVKCLTGRSHGLQILSAVTAQSEVELMPCDRLLDGLVVAIELIPDGGPDEVGSVGIEALLHQEVDMAEVHIAEIDRDFLAVGSLRPQFLHSAHRFHPDTIQLDGIWSINPGIASSGRPTRRSYETSLHPLTCQAPVRPRRARKWKARR